MGCGHKGIADLLACPLCSRDITGQQGNQLGTALAPPAPVAPLPNAREARIAFLERKREATKADLLLKFEDVDYHGVADAAMDLRDIESELKGLRFQ